MTSEDTKELCWVNMNKFKDLEEMSGEYVEDGNRNTLIPVSKHEEEQRTLSEQISEEERVMGLMSYSVWN